MNIMKIHQLCEFHMQLDKYPNALTSSLFSGIPKTGFSEIDNVKIREDIEEAIYHPTRKVIDEKLLEVEEVIKKTIESDAPKAKEEVTISG